MGSAGFAVFREIVAHIKTTNWVLNSSIEYFPLLYHWRIVPTARANCTINEKEHEKYIRYWNNNKKIDQFIRDRARARYEAILFLEHIPYTLGSWLDKNIGSLDWVLSQNRETLDFLRHNVIIHFDCHHGNILTNGDKIYFTDFGLLLDQSFSLTKRELAFFEENKYYDYGEFLSGLGDHIYSKYSNLSKSRKEKLIRHCGLVDEINLRHIKIVLPENIDQISASGLIKLNAQYVDKAAKYSSIIGLMNEFFFGMFQNNRKNTKYSHATLKRFLEETGFVDRT